VGKKHLKAFMIGLNIFIAFWLIWMNKWNYVGVGPSAVRTNKITGKTQVLTLYGWLTLEQERINIGPKRTKTISEDVNLFLKNKGFITIDELPDNKEIRKAAAEYNEKVAEILDLEKKRFP
jgi:hypothetical protein